MKFRAGSLRSSLTSSKPRTSVQSNLIDYLQECSAILRLWFANHDRFGEFAATGIVKGSAALSHSPSGFPIFLPVGRSTARSSYAKNARDFPAINTQRGGTLPSYLIASRSVAKRKKKAPATCAKRIASRYPAPTPQAREAGRPSGLCDYVSAYYAERVFNAGPLFLGITGPRLGFALASLFSLRLVRQRAKRKTFNTSFNTRERCKEREREKSSNLRKSIKCISRKRNNLKK